MKKQGIFLNKLGWQFLLLMLLTIVLPSVLFFLMIVNRYGDDLLQQTTDERAGVLRELNRMANFQMKDYRELSMTVYYNDTTKEFLDWEDHSETTEGVDAVLQSMRNTIPYIDSVVLCFGENVHDYGRKFANLPEYREKYEAQVMAAEGRCVWLPTECMVSGEGALAPKSFALGRTLNSREGPVGVMYLFCSHKFFRNIMSNPLLSAEGSHYYILAHNGQVVSSDIYSQVGTVADLGFTPEQCVGAEGFLNLRETGQIATYSAISGLDWISVIVSDTDSIYRSLDDLEEMSGAFIVLYLLALALGYGMLYFLLIRPLSRLSDGMTHVAQGEFLEVPTGLIRNEVQQVTESYNDMVVHIRQLMQQIREEEKAKNRQRIKVLYMQIGPHFLYNTLNSIKWMAALNHQTGIRNMVDALIKLVSNVTYAKKDHVSIRQELELLDSYVYIQKVRFTNFKIEYDVPPEVLELQIGRFMIQPFVENSILHGLRGLAYEGVVRIKIRSSETLCVEISDNGRGFDPAAPQEQPAGENGHDHVGIDNVKERIGLNYGPDYGVRVESTIGSGTTVYLTLPVLREEEAE